MRLREETAWPRGAAGDDRMTLDDFMAEAEHLVTKAQAMLRRDGGHAPILFLFGPDGLREIVALKVRTGTPAHAVVRAVVTARKPEAFVFIAEGWMVEGPAAARPGPSPSRHPERREVLSVSAVHPAGRAGWFIPFSREGGRVVFGQMVHFPGGDLAGPLPEALTDES